jgi:2-methylcitrate dehydratase
MVAHEGDLGSHRYPTTKEIADHSAYFTAALAIVDRDVRLTLDQFTPERLRDERLREIIDKVELVGVPEAVLERSDLGLEWRDDQAPTKVEISTTDGRSLSAEAQFPKGHFRNPLSDADLERKFRTMARASMREPQLQRAFDAIWRLDEMADVSELARTLVFAG